MTKLNAAMGAVENGLKMAQIGQPVAARIVAHLTSDHGMIQQLSAEAMALAAKWLGGKTIRLTAVGGVEAGQITVLAHLDGGQSALVSAGLAGMGRPLLAVEIWGNHGILTWEDDPFALGQSYEPDLSNPMVNRLASQIQSSMAARSPVFQTNRSIDKRIESSRDLRAQSPPFGLLLVAGDHTHQPNYAEAIMADGRCRLVGITDEEQLTDRRRRLNQQLADRLGIPVFTDLRQALNRDDVQIVSICAEPIRRGRIAVLAAQAGKHLYLDKPFAGSITDASAVVAAIDKARVVGHMFSQVHSPATKHAKSIIESGELGDLTAIHFDLCFAKGYAGSAKLGSPRIEASNPQRFELAESKRELSNVGVYPLVQLLSLCGRNIRRVTATTGNYFFAEHQKNDMEDFGQLLLELDGGLMSTISVGRTGWQSSPGGGLNRIFLMGTNRCALVDAHRPRVEIWSDAKPWSPPRRNPDDPMAMWQAPPDSPFTAGPRQSWIAVPTAGDTSDARYFLDCVEHGRESIVSASVAASTTEVLMAGYESAATHKTVDVASA